jgi:F420-non-reducing hydrogenase small subunit
MARLLRRKSQLLLAFGACSWQGGIPALANIGQRKEYLRAIYQQGPSLSDLAGPVPTVKSRVPEGELDLPSFDDRVKALGDVVGVDYFVPGCPPEPHQIWALVQMLIAGETLPPKGSVLGAGRSTVCQECTRKKNDKKIPRFYRTYEIQPDAEICLLEQGIVCMGVATRDGCNALCPRVNMPCIGCYGLPEGVTDQGAKMVAALGSVLDLGKYQGMSGDQVAEKTDVVGDSLADGAGTFYKFSGAASVLGERPR